MSVILFAFSLSFWVE